MTTHLGNEMFCSTSAGTPAKKKKKKKGRGGGRRVFIRKQMTVKDSRFTFRGIHGRSDLFVTMAVQA